MIKINTEKFDWRTINEIYDSKEGITQVIVKKLQQYIQGKKANKIVCQIYKEMFGDDIEYSKVRELLLGDRKMLIKYSNLYEKCNLDIDNAIYEFWNLSSQTLICNVRGKINNEEFIRCLEKEFAKEISESKKLTKNKKKIFLKQEYNKEYEKIEVMEIVAKHFDYGWFTKMYRHKVIEAMRVQVCPYCNRQYITNYYEEGRISKTTADLDHFYPKSKYPYLALSLYNFIPSCQICNSRFKGDDNSIDSEHLYPYEEEFGENAKFKIYSETIDYMTNKSKANEFELEIDYEELRNKDKQLFNAIERSIEVFKLDKVYQGHKSYVAELIIKASKYNKSQREEYARIFNDLFESEEEVFNIVFGEYIRNKNFSEHPLSKLTSDILDELEGVK